MLFHLFVDLYKALYCNEMLSFFVDIDRDIFSLTRVIISVVSQDTITVLAHQPKIAATSRAFVLFSGSAVSW